MLSANDLADAKIMEPKSIPVVVLPYGPVFPAEAVKNWKRYLHEGGNFFSTGGYAFDEAVWRKDGKWQTWEQLVAGDPKYVVNGRFDGSDGWTVEGDKKAVHFGPDPNRHGELGLVIGYPYETSYKTGGRETSATVKQTIAAPPVGRYEINFMRYARWTKGAVASQGYDLSLVRFGPHTEGPRRFLGKFDHARFGRQDYTNVRSLPRRRVGRSASRPGAQTVRRYSRGSEHSDRNINGQTGWLCGSFGSAHLSLARSPRDQHPLRQRWGWHVG